VEFLLEFPVNVIENDSFSSQTVNGLPQVFVVGDGLVELLVGLVQSVLEDLDLLVQLRVLFLGPVRSFLLPLLLNDFICEQLYVLPHLVLELPFSLYLLLNERHLLLVLVDLPAHALTVQLLVVRVLYCLR